MKLRTGILLLAILSGIAYAQNPDVIQDTRSTLQNVQKKQTIDQNAALSAAGQNSPAAPSSQTAGTPAGNTAAAATAGKTKAGSASKATAKSAAGKTAKPKPVPEAANNPAVAVEDKKNPVEPKKDEKSFSMAGRRDPFVSPVVSRAMVTTGCSSGKRCLAIDQIVLTGIVKSDSGMIAVVVNSMNKAYFLRQNDPVFNGYVVRITGDSVVFQETVQDNLGKPLTREVTKKISVPAV